MKIMTLFELPSNILSSIYEMDSTYRFILKTQISPEIISKSYDTFRNNFINNPFFDNEPPIIARKINVLLEYLFKYENRSIINKMNADQISIDINWKGMDYSNHTISIDDTGYNNINTGLYIGIYSNDQPFEVFGYYVYTIDQYNEMEKTSSFLEKDLEKIIFKNDEFVVLQSYEEQFYDDGDDGDDDDDYWGNNLYDDDDY